MTFVDDARRAIPAAAALFRFDPQAISRFDHSFEGFIRSFAVLIPVAVIYLALCQIEYRYFVPETIADAPPPAVFYTWKMIALVVDWFAFPIIMVPISRAMGLGRRYVPLIVAINWMALIAVAIWSGPAFLFAFGFAGDTATAFLSLAAFLYVIAVTAFTIKTALDSPGGLTAALTALYLVIGLLIAQAGDRMIGI